jgi:hypothetical protein
LGGFAIGKEVAMNLKVIVVLLSVIAFQVPVPPVPVPSVQVPGLDAMETVWSDYVAKRFRTGRGVVSVSLEHRLPDESRVDIYVIEDIRKTAWEVERAAKWKEAIGQALFYQIMTDAERGGVILISLDNVEDKAYILRCMMVCRKVGLELLVVDEKGAIR